MNCGRDGRKAYDDGNDYASEYQPWDDERTDVPGAESEITDCKGTFVQSV